MGFTAPLDDIRVALDRAADCVPSEATAPDAMDHELRDAVLGEAGRFAGEVLAPLNRVGDTHPARLVDGRVETPPGWREAYAQWRDGGWNGVHFPAEIGGQGLPFAVNVAIAEMINAACMAFSLGPLLTQGAVDALRIHASDQLKERFLRRMVEGAWTGTMNLTEPQSGSDLAALKTRAAPAGDGTYRISGQKIYITHGEHDWTDNIIHMVLARLPDAPPGTRGISLFLVPRILVNDDGSLGARNDVRCIGVEQKLGIHGSPTCVMEYGAEGGAVGYLVGEEHRGLACMFTMMNAARLMVGVQGVGIGERATQAARAHAADRRQGRRAGDAPDVSVSIDRHPDVRRMLMTMRTLTMASRQLCYESASLIDALGRTTDPRIQARIDLLTPIAKAFSTDCAVEVASLGVQVHGGMGYVEETGAAQHLRDARILPIYEGTNGIQAIDLALRKVARDDGAAARLYCADLRETVREVAGLNDPLLGAASVELTAALDNLEAATDWIVGTAGTDTDAVLSVAAPYLRLFGLTSGGVHLARAALHTLRETGARADREATRQRVMDARFYAESLLPETGALRRTVQHGGEAVMSAVLPAA